MTMACPSRRSLLKTFSGSTFAAATMRFFIRSAEASTYPTRFLFLYTHNGRDRESMCTGTGTNFVLGPGYAALEPLKQKITILDGLKIPAHVNEEHPNGRCAMLTGRASAAAWAGTGISIDRYLANKLTSGRSLYTGIEMPNPGREQLDQPISWEGANAPNNGFLLGSDNLMKRVFNGMPVMPAASTPSAPKPSSSDPDEVALYDHLMNEVERLQKVAPLAQAEKLNLHVQSLSQLRSGFLEGNTGGGGPDGTLPACTQPNATSKGNAISQVGLVMAHAFACGQARIGVINMGIQEPHHEYSHWESSGDHEKLKAVDKQDANNILTLLRHLDSFREGTGTLLDNTLVVWSSEVSGFYGKGEDVHDTVQMPFVLAGGMGGRFKMGQRIVADDRTNVDLYRTVAMQMGVDNPTDYGDAKMFGGPLLQIVA